MKIRKGLRLSPRAGGPRDAGGTGGMRRTPALFAGGMLDLARTVILLLAVAQAIHHRFALGMVFGAILCAAFAWIGWDSYVALEHHAVGGQYGIGYVYFGPTMVPRGGRDWTPLAMQGALAMLSAVPAFGDRRAAHTPAASAFLLLFLPSAVLVVIAALGGYVEWRQG